MVDSITKSQVVERTQDEMSRGPDTRTTDNEINVRSCLALLGGFLAFFTSIGFMNAFGIFQEYYKTHQLRSKSDFDISWLGSFAMFCMFTVAPAAGMLVDRMGPAPLLVIGGVISCLAIFMTSLCEKYYQFFLAQALLLGIGMGFTCTTAMGTLPRYFVKHRALGMGIMVAGSSTGGIIWPIMLNQFLNVRGISFGWALRIVGFMMLPLYAIVCCTLRFPKGQHPASGAQSHDTETQQTFGQEKSVVVVPGMRSPTFIILCVGLAFLYLGFFGPFFYLSSYAVSNGHSSSFSFNLLSILNGASFVGRILPGILADRYGKFNLLVITGIASALIGFTWTAATSVAGITVWGLAYGFASGAIMSLQGACATVCVPKEIYGKAIGAVMGSAALAGLFGAPICGQLLTHYGYLASSMWTGATITAGTVCVIVSRLTLDRRPSAII